MGILIDRIHIDIISRKNFRTHRFVRKDWRKDVGLRASSHKKLVWQKKVVPHPENVVPKSPNEVLTSKVNVFMSYNNAYNNPLMYPILWPYVANDHQRYLTNNYIESWHNQLKTIYFGCTRIRRLDRLVFILTNDVEFFYDEEVERIHIQNGQMDPIENELARHSFSANTIQDDMLPFMIINPLNKIGNSMEDSNSKESNHLQLQRSLASEHEVAVVNEEVENETNIVVVSGRNNSVWLQRIMAQNTTLYNQREDLEQLMEIPGIDEAKLQVISGLLEEAMNLIDTLRNANSSRFRNLNTQR
ncbi:hypothetical protein PHYBLDRAFT_165752 [Phycomyces blakesleeanus NRRL 1555(-)]|uniref:Uncharacterized protein n=1 Tax=Phycomyces blakesleeanus (strain ATCC 8743b / DSM 1359 / FGSC 10004 / NBRC 33097 / NRRL 1555) TaxID=763407 RepID=A0A162PZI3_PHYB8|nr:hypothetical protein PHYBLDRAFT_165752 [Phycomyces blakesleeanus NRRL 1555(-)]OAD75766.1 hypothetical protein PHYBLDRAFT_165752 [Phycomyces blakesleeanus NRRL 1555(-)]|eukprot:XP_018293806.1 hypothetical protein PHYBLDRAFT_165752 [Phycomyces blakesleeanus NRRL 1555(-)]